MIAWPQPRAARSGPDTAIGSALTLLAAGLPTGGIALLAREVAAHRVLVADGTLAGRDMRVPSGLLAPAPVLLPTDGLRLPLAWTMACGGRPSHFVAVPIPDHDLHLIAAWCEDRAIPLDTSIAAATVIARLLGVGQLPRLQSDASERIHALVRHLPVPLVFVDALGGQVLINDEARRLLRLAAGEARPAVIAALARLISLEVTRDQQHAMASDRTARLSFEIERDGQTFKVDSHWIDGDTKAGGDLSGRIWIFADVTEAKSLQASLARLAGEDPLTGVPNRRAFEARIAAALDHAERTGAPLALLTVDLDHFKAINDTHGHQAGDRVLREVCGIIGDELDRHALLARIGGEEFAVLLPDTMPQAAAAIANRLCAAIRAAELHMLDGTLKVTASIGLAAYAHGADTLDTLFARSDGALYAAKRNGRDRVVQG